MFDFLMLADAASHATQDVQSGLSSHNWLMVAAGGLVLIAPIVLKAFGISVPVLDPLLDAGLSLLDKSQEKAPAPIDPAVAKAELQKIADDVKPVLTVVPPPADPAKPTDPPAGK